MTMKFGNFANFIVRNFVVIWEAPTFGREKGREIYHSALPAACRVAALKVLFVVRVSQFGTWVKTGRLSKKFWLGLARHLT